MRRRTTRRSGAHAAAVAIVAAVTAVGLAGPVNATEPTQASSRSKSSTYTVVKGDTLSSIARRTGVPASTIASANSLASPDRLREGMQLRIPQASKSTAAAATKPARAATIPRGTYKVVAGDTIERISRRSGVSVASLAAVNGLRAPEYPIYEGQTLTIATARGSAATSAAKSGGARSTASARTLKPGRYTVQRGDNVIGIARRAGIAPRAIIAANGLAAPSYMIRAGATLTIPSGSAAAKPAKRSGGPGPSTAPETRGGPVAGSGYRVRRGDTVIGIASRAGVSAGAIIAANGLAPPRFMVRDGQVLQIPKKGAGTIARRTSPVASGSASTGSGRHPNRAQVGAALDANARRYGLPPDLVKGLAWQESGWRQESVSSVGAVGVMQLMPGTAQWIGDKLLRRKIDSQNYTDNIQGGTAYLDYLLGQVGQDERRALASYYQGLGSVKKRGLLKESERYVASVQANRKRFR